MYSNVLLYHYDAVLVACDQKIVRVCESECGYHTPVPKRKMEVGVGVPVPEREIYSRLSVSPSGCGLTQTH